MAASPSRLRRRASTAHPHRHHGLRHQRHRHRHLGGRFHSDQGIGSNVATDTFLAQFNGMDGTQNIAIGQGGFDAYSGATISSKALFAAINDCVNCYNELA